MITEKWTLGMLRVQMDQTDIREEDYADKWDLPKHTVQDMDSEESFCLIDLPVGHELEVCWPDGNIGRGLGDVVSVRM